MQEAVDRITQGRAWGELSGGEKTQVVLTVMSGAGGGLLGLAVLVIVVGGLFWFLA